MSKPHLFDVQTQKEIAISDAWLFQTPWCVDPQLTGDTRWAADSSHFTFFYNRGCGHHGVLRVIGGGERGDRGGEGDS